MDRVRKEKQNAGKFSRWFGAIFLFLDGRAHAGDWGLIKLFLIRQSPYEW